MKKLVRPNLKIDFAPSPRQMQMWIALQPDCCDKCMSPLEFKVVGKDEYGNDISEAVCTKCGNTDIPEQVLSGGAARRRKELLRVLLADFFMYAIRGNTHGCCA